MRSKTTTSVAADPHSKDHKLRRTWREATCTDPRWDAWTKTLARYIETPRTWPELQAWYAVAWPGFTVEFIQHLLAFLSLRGRAIFNQQTQRWQQAAQPFDHIATMRNPPKTSIADMAAPASIEATTNYSFKNG